MEISDENCREATGMPYGWRKTGETYTCERCGKPTSNRKLFTCGPIGGKVGYSWCDECISDFDRELEWKNEQSFKENITCPWCGYEDPDSWEFEGEYDDAYECPECGKKFILEVHTEVTYTSKRRIEDMPEGWRGDD